MASEETLERLRRGQANLEVGLDYAKVWGNHNIVRMGSAATSLAVLASQLFARHESAQGITLPVAVGVGALATVATTVYEKYLRPRRTRSEIRQTDNMIEAFEALPERDNQYTLNTCMQDLEAEAAKWREDAARNDNAKSLQEELELKIQAADRIKAWCKQGRWRTGDYPDEIAMSQILSGIIDLELIDSPELDTEFSPCPDVEATIKILDEYVPLKNSTWQEYLQTLCEHKDRASAITKFTPPMLTF